MRIYALLCRLPLPKSYLGKILLATFVGLHLPLLGLVAYLAANSAIGLGIVVGILPVVFVATLVGVGATLYVTYALLVPVGAASRALREYREHGIRPELPTHFTDRAGVLMADVQQTVEQLDGVVRSLEDLSTVDPLTRLPNRVLFADRLERALARSGGAGRETRRRSGRETRHDNGREASREARYRTKRETAGEARVGAGVEKGRRQEESGGEPAASSLAILFLDLDNFKVVNDSLGHDVGDRVLVAVAEHLRRCVRPQDTVARFGGDEFTVLLEDANRAEATGVAKRIVQALQRPLAVAEEEMVVGASVGIALAGDTTEEPGDLIRKADIALYRAKEGGGSAYVLFEEDMDIRARERLAVEGELRRAAEREELVIYYQPIAHLETGKIAGFEALLRWQHLQQGLLLPERFIRVAEESGLMVSIGHWVLEEVSRQLARWREDYPDAPSPSVNVNLSARQFERPELVGEVEEILRERKLDPSILKLEITESVAMNDAPSTIETVEGLRALGARIVIDDFGTGYSSLGYLTRFPVDALKIDRSIVEGLDRDPKKAAVARTIVTLAHSLGYRVVAEGIETTAQLEYLRELGCEMGQGNLFWEPRPAGAAMKLYLRSVERDTV